MASLDNTKINEIRFLNSFFDQRIKNKLSIYVDDLEKLEKIEDIKGVQKDIAWGSQIRSYTFMPYTLVKDHRTGYEVGNVEAVMDGEIDGFIESYLKQDVT